MRVKTEPALNLKKVPTFESLQRFAERFPALDPDALSASLSLLCIGGQLQEAFIAHFARHGLSHARFRVLVTLLRAGDEDVTPAELADKLSVTRATVTGLVDGLVRSGHVARTENPTDRRQKQIRLTAKGRRQIERVLPDHFQRVTALMAGLKTAEMKQLVLLLNKVAPGLPALREP